MILDAYATTGFTVAGIHAWWLLQHPADPFHQRVLTMALWLGGISALLQPISSDVLAKVVAFHHPAKLAAFEGQFATKAGAPFRLGGVPDLDRGRLDCAIEIPYALSVMLYLDPTATVTGLDIVPRDQWPPVAVARGAFQVMILCGVAMVFVTVWAGWQWWRYRAVARSRLFLKALVLVSPLGFVATEAGWIAAEVGRQAWIITGFMRTAAAVTPMPGLLAPLVFFGALYLMLAAIVLRILRHHIAAGFPVDPSVLKPSVGRTVYES